MSRLCRNKEVKKVGSVLEILRRGGAVVVGSGGFFLACEDFGRMFDTSFPAYASFIYV